MLLRMPSRTDKSGTEGCQTPERDISTAHPSTSHQGACSASWQCRPSPMLCQVLSQIGGTSIIKQKSVLRERGRICCRSPIPVTVLKVLLPLVSLMPWEESITNREGGETLLEIILEAGICIVVPGWSPRSWICARFSQAASSRRKSTSSWATHPGPLPVSTGTRLAGFSNRWFLLHQLWEAIAPFHQHLCLQGPSLGSRCLWPTPTWRIHWEGRRCWEKVQSGRCRDWFHWCSHWPWTCDCISPPCQAGWTFHPFFASCPSPMDFEQACFAFGWELDFCCPLPSLLVKFGREVFRPLWMWTSPRELHHPSPSELCWGACLPGCCHPFDLFECCGHSEQPGLCFWCFPEQWCGCLYRCPWRHGGDPLVRNRQARALHKTRWTLPFLLATAWWGWWPPWWWPSRWCRLLCSSFQGPLVVFWLRWDLWGCRSRLKSGYSPRPCCRPYAWHFGVGTLRLEGFEAAGVDFAYGGELSLQELPHRTPVHDLFGCGLSNGPVVSCASWILQVTSKDPRRQHFGFSWTCSASTRPTSLHSLWPRTAKKVKNDVGASLEETPSFGLHRAGHCLLPVWLPSQEGICLLGLWTSYWWPGSQVPRRPWAYQDWGEVHSSISHLCWGTGPSCCWILLSCSDEKSWWSAPLPWLGECPFEWRAADLSLEACRLCALAHPSSHQFVGDLYGCQGAQEAGFASPWYSVLDFPWLASRSWCPHQRQEFFPPTTWTLSQISRLADCWWAVSGVALRTYQVERCWRPYPWSFTKTTCSTVDPECSWHWLFWATLCPSQPTYSQLGSALAAGFLAPAFWCFSRRSFLAWEPLGSSLSLWTFARLVSQCLASLLHFLSRGFCSVGYLGWLVCPCTLPKN